MATTPQLVIGVPGQWEARSDLTQAIVSRSGGYIFAGMTLLKTGSPDESFTLEVHPPDPQLRETFAIAGGRRFSASELDAIGAHTFGLYLVTPGGSIEAARQALHAVNGLLKAGGLAVKIESAGVAHRAERWAKFCEADNLGALLSAYVTYIGSPGHYYSCGLHNLGLPDVEVEGDLSPNAAAELLHTFAGYLLFERPTLNSGETFSIAPDAPYYRLLRADCTRYPPDDLFHNPFGLWKLEPVRA